MAYHATLYIFAEKHTKRQIKTSIFS